MAYTFERTVHLDMRLNAEEMEAMTPAEYEAFYKGITLEHLYADWADTMRRETEAQAEAEAALYGTGHLAHIIIY